MALFKSNNTPLTKNELDRLMAQNKEVASNKEKNTKLKEELQNFKK